MKISPPSVAYYLAAAVSMMASFVSFASTPAPATAALTSQPEPAACMMRLDGFLLAAPPHCVVSGDQGMVKPSAMLGAPVIWDRIIVDPNTRNTLNQVTA